MSYYTHVVLTQYPLWFFLTLDCLKGNIAISNKRCDLTFLNILIFIWNVPIFYFLFLDFLYRHVPRLNKRFNFNERFNFNKRFNCQRFNCQRFNFSEQQRLLANKDTFLHGSLVTFMQLDISLDQRSLFLNSNILLGTRYIYYFYLSSIDRFPF